MLPQIQDLSVVHRANHRLNFSIFKNPVVWILFAAAAILFAGLDQAPLMPFDDASYADVSKNIVKDGGWLHLRWLGGYPFLEKPPLYFWLTALFFYVFGIGEFGARLFPALCGIGTLAVVYVFAWRYLSRESAFICAILLMAVNDFWEFSSRAMLDMPTTFFVTLSLFFFCQSLQLSKTLHYLLYGAAFSLAILTKSAVGLIPVLVTFAFLAGSDPRGLLSRNYWIGNLFGIGLASTWPIFAYFRYGDIFLREFFGYHIIQRVLGNITIHQKPFLYFAEYLYDSERFILVGFAVALPFLLFHSIRSRSRVHILLLIWICVVFFGISFSQAKLPNYVVPLYPPVVMAIGFASDSLRRKQKGFSWPYMMVAGIILALAAHTAYGFRVDRNSQLSKAFWPGQLRTLLKEVRINSESDEVVYIFRVGDAVHMTNFYADRKMCFLDDSPSLLEIQQKIPSDYVAKGVVRKLSGIDELTKMISECNGIYLLQKKVYEQINRRLLLGIVAESDDLIAVRLAS